MKMYHCGKCDQLLLFENTTCVKCNGVLAFLPDKLEMVTLEEVGKGESRWRPVKAKGDKSTYLLCKNYSAENVCNWALQEDDPNPYCSSCRLTRIIPNLSQPNARELWARLEAAKRRLLYSLRRLELAIVDREEDPNGGLAFEFLADPEPGSAPASPVLTGHSDGLITINIAEADDAERERRRHQMGEPYRTLLGHFRHEIGHYYLTDHRFEGHDQFRSPFGDGGRRYDEARKFTTAARRRRLASARSSRMRPHILGKTGPSLGPTTSIWSTRSKRPSTGAR